MSKLNRLIPLVLVLFCVGCQRQPQVTPPPSPPVNENAIGKTVSVAPSLEVFIENPIELITTDGANFSSLSIDGLKDKAVQDTINEALQLLFKEMEDFALRKNMPPYRGIQTLFQKSPASSSFYYHVYSTYNANNILSVLGLGFVSLDVDGNQKTFTHMKPVSFDLNTGKPIELSQIFIDNSNGIIHINDILTKDFAGSEDELEVVDDLFFFDYRSYHLIKPFTGIDASWPFILSPYGLQICFDHRATDFDMAQGAFSMMIPFTSIKDDLAFHERFMLGHSLYETPKPNMTFYQEPIPNERSKIIEETINGISWYIDSSFITENPVIDEKVQTVLEEKHTWVNQQLNEQPDYKSVSMTASASKTGPYTTVHLYTTLYGDNAVKNQEDAFAFDAQGTLLTLDTLFAPEFNYAKYLMDYVNAQLLSSEYKDLILPEDAINDVGFKLESTGLYLYYYDDAVMDYPLGFYLEYSEIGLENLTLFSKYLPLH